MTDTYMPIAAQFTLEDGTVSRRSLVIPASALADRSHLRHEIDALACKTTWAPSSVSTEFDPKIVRPLHEESAPAVLELRDVALENGWTVETPKIIGEPWIYEIGSGMALNLVWVRYSTMGTVVSGRTLKQRLPRSDRRAWIREYFRAHGNRR